MSHILKFAIIAFVLLFTCTKAHCQEQATTNITGVVLDSLYRPLEYAAIQLFTKQDTVFCCGAVTQPDGAYTLKKVKQGEYLIKVSAIGYQPTEKLIRIDKPKRNTPIGFIQLKDEVFDIEEVKVVGTSKGFTERVDKTVFVPDSVSLRTAKTGIDIIRKIPEVRVSKRNNAISIMGNKNVLILINGVDNNRSIESIHPDNIERVEIITHPSVKYRSDIASVINIVLKGYREKGITVSSNLYYSLNKYNHMGNMRVDYQLGKLRLFAGYNGFYNKNESIDSTLLIDKGENDLYEHKTSPLANNKASMYYTRVQYGFDYIFSDRNLFNFTSSVISNNMESYRYSNVFSTVNTTPLKSSNVESLYTLERPEQTYSLYYMHKFKKENQTFAVNTNIYALNEESDHLIKDSSQFYSPASAFYSTRNTNSQSKQKSINSKIDYNHPINDKFNLETGYQFYTRDILSHIVSTGNDEGSLNYLDMRNTLYANLVFSYEKLGFQSGVRVENTNLTFFETDYNKTEYLPFGSFLYKPNPKNSFKLTYRKTLSYPKYSFLSPYRYYSSDSLYVRMGNPYLKPEHKHNIDLKYSLKSQSTYLAASLYYNNIDNIIFQKNTHANNLISSTYENLGKAQQYGVDLSFSTVIFDWLELEMFLSGDYTDFREGKDKNGFSYAAEFGVVAPLFAGFDLEVFGIIVDRELDYNGYSNYGGYIDEILITKDITKNLFIGFAVWQPFFKPRDTYKQWGNTYSETNRYTEVNSTSYLLNITYFFRSGKKIRKIDKEIFIEDTAPDKRKPRN